MTRVETPWMRAALLLLLLAVASAWVHWNAWVGMVSIWWRSDTFAHAFLVPPIVAWLVWRQRHALATLTPTPSAWGALPLLLGVSLTVVGELAQVNAAQHFGLVFIVQGATWLVLGNAITRRLAFPLLFLLFAPPFGEFLLPSMMNATADFTVGALRLTGVPVYREGLQFVIPSGQWSVVEACSGVRYLMASVMVGALFAYLNFNRWPKRVAFIAFATLMPLLANWVRAYLIVMLGHLSSNELATGADHLVYGWVFFGLIMMLMFWLGSRFADPLPEADQLGRPGNDTSAKSAYRGLAPLLAGLLMVTAGLWSTGLREASTLGAEHLSLGSPPVGFEPDDAENPGLGTVPGADAELRWRADGPAGSSVHVYVGYVAYQRQEARAVASTSVVVSSQDKRWQVLGAQLIDEAGMQQEQLSLRGREPSVEGEWRVRRFYWVDGWFGINRIEAKLRGLWQLASGRGDAAAMVVLAVRGAPDPDQELSQQWQRLRDPLNGRLRDLGSTPGAGHNAAP